MVVWLTKKGKKEFGRQLEKKSEESWPDWVTISKEPEEVQPPPRKRSREGESVAKPIKAKCARMKRSQFTI